MAKRDTNLNAPSGEDAPPTVFEYYTKEVFDFHLPGNEEGDGSNGSEGKLSALGRAASAAQNTSNTLTGQIIGGAGVALGLIGEVMSLPNQIADAILMPILKQLAFLQGIAVLPMAKQLDPVLGLDVHMVTIPGNPAPVPMPHIYVATVFDPKDWKSCIVMAAVAALAPAGPDPALAGTPDGDAEAALNVAFNAAMMVGSMKMGKKGMNATVSTGPFVPRAIAGSINKAIVHVPMGAGFHPTFAMVKKHRGHMFMGSLFVSTDMEALGCFLFPNMGCWDVGSPELKRMNSGPKAGELFQPTGIVLAIPWNNVIVNPVPVPMNPAGYIIGKIMGGFAKKKKTDASQSPPKKTPEVAGTNKQKRCTNGHPVDMATGQLFTDEEDFHIPGVIPISFERTWYSDSEYEGPLGHGWHHSYDLVLTVDKLRNTAKFRMADGRMASFPIPENLESSQYNRTEKLFLHVGEDQAYYITNANNLIFRFGDPIQNDGLDSCRLISIENRNGFAIRFSYDSSGFLTRILDTANREILFTNDKKGRIVEVKAPHPSTFEEDFILAQYLYDEAGDLIKQTNAIGDSFEFRYVNHLMIEETWRNGSKWFFLYDGRKTGAKCIETWGDGDIYHYNMTYEAGLTHAINGLGVKTSYFHKNGLVYNEIDGNGESWKKRYNEFGELELESDPLGNETIYAHDKFGNIETKTDPCGGFSACEYYHPRFPHALMEAIDTNGGKWKFKYDDQGNLIQRINPKGAVLKISYESGLPISILEESGGTTVLSFDHDHNLTEMVEPLGATWKYKYDHLGRCGKETNPNGLNREINFDLAGRVTNVQDYDGNRIHLEYDGNDNILRYRDAQKDVKYTYNILKKMTSHTEAGHTIYFKYDSQGQLLEIVNEKGLPYHFALDKNGNITKEIGFDGLTREYQRNAAGWVTRLKRPSGQNTHYTHDTNGRVTEVNYHTDEKESYTYFPSGLLKSALNSDAKVEFKRDAFGQVIEETCNGEAISSEYDMVGRRISLKSSLGADINYAFDIQSNVTTMAGGNAQTRWESKLKYDTLGLEIERMLPGGLTNHWKRDDLGRPVEQSLGHGNSTKHQRRYKWGINDRLSEILDSVTGKSTFTHDERGYLTGAKYEGQSQLRNPDAVGNLFETEARTDRKYGNGGCLLKKGATTYEYDLEGNLSTKKTPKGNWHYHWNAAGMLCKVIRPDKEEVTFAYDALGRRIWKKFKKTITNFAWDGNVPLHEWKTFDFKEGSPDDLITWFFESDGFVPAGKIRGDKQYSICADHLGTPSRVYDADGALVWHMELDSYGRERVLKGDVGACPFRYQGQYVDAETGLYYNRFRYFDAEDGRYLSQDPIGLASGNASFYGYVSDTNVLVDSLGLESLFLLNEHLRQTEIYGKGGVKELENGRIRYYEDLQPASKSGEMKGMRVVREWDPATGKKRTWMETLDHNGKVRQVRPQESITNGKKIHYRFDQNGEYTGTKEGVTRNGRPLNGGCP